MVAKSLFRIAILLNLFTHSRACPQAKQHYIAAVKYFSYNFCNLKDEELFVKRDKKMGFCSSLFKTFFFIAFCWLGVTLWLFSRLNHELFEHKPPTEARSMKVDIECEGIKVIRQSFYFHIF